MTIYLDHHATTPLDPRVLEAMLPYFTTKFGNPGSVHSFGEEAREAVDASRQTIASLIGAEASEIVFTSGATESNNLAIRGVAERKRRRGNHLVSVKTEHPAVLDPLALLAERDYEVTLLDVEPQDSPLAGYLDPARVAHAIRDDTCLVSVMLANNEIGVLQPIAEIAAVCKSRGVLLHCDATQAVGKVPVDVRQLDVDLMSFTAHKFYGPKGIGALYVRRRDPVVRLATQIAGGGQEQGRRSGTLNVPGIVGMAEALRLACAEMASDTQRIASLRDELARGIFAAIPSARLVGPALDATDKLGQPLRLANNLNVRFPGTDGEALMLSMPDLAVSSGAACSSMNDEPSHVLRALGLSSDEARSCLRFGLGRFTTAAEIAEAIRLGAGAVQKVTQFGG
ncbi:cysteine desulfurase family protein [Aeoliella sp. SH292]|uniref:cysteine desulfurase family protein n=1 Tax=Aeoliella sp. SH292 TaxID=3454464 RepID=UPI003F9E65CD